MDTLKVFVDSCFVNECLLGLTSKLSKKGNTTSMFCEVFEYDLYTQKKYIKLQKLCMIII